MSKFSRTIGLLGEENFNNIQNKTIFIAGLGGVGGTAFISLLRTGFRKFIIADFDSVDETNLNRQVIYTSADIGKMKTDVAKHYALSINDAAEIITVSKKINQELLNELKKFNIDFIIDCIDDISGKVDLVRFANELNVPIVCSLGMANKLDPSSIKVGRLNKATCDPLGKKFRYELKKSDINFSNIDVVYSTETPKKDGAKLNSIITVTSTAGLYLCNFVVSYFIEIE